MADMKWNEINANFSDVNSGVSNAITGYSNVGDIFGKLRQSILDEEQRAWERAHKEKEFAENQYQFDANQAQDWWKHEDKMGLDWANHDENIRQFDENLKQKDRHHNDDMALQRQSLAQRGAELAIRQMEAKYRMDALKKEDARKQGIEEIIKRNSQLAFGEAENIQKTYITPLNQRLQELSTKLEDQTLTSDQRAALETEAKETTKLRDQYEAKRLGLTSYNALENSIIRDVAIQYGEANVNTPYKELAKDERARAAKSVSTGTSGNTTTTGSVSGAGKGLTTMRTLLKEMHLKPADQAMLLESADALQKEFPNASPEQILEAAIIWAGPVSKEALWGDRNKFPTLWSSDIAAMRNGTPMSKDAQDRYNLIRRKLGGGNMPNSPITLPSNTSTNNSRPVQKRY